MFHNGRVAFVRHCSVYARVSTNRLVNHISSPRSDESCSEKTRSNMVPHTETVKGSHDNKSQQSRNCQDLWEALGADRNDVTEKSISHC